MYMMGFQKKMFFMEIIQRKLICIAYELCCYYILSKAPLFSSPLFLKNMVIAPFPHVVNFKFLEELSLLKLFIFSLSVGLYGSSKNRITLISISKWHLVFFQALTLFSANEISDKIPLTYHLLILERCL